MIFLQRNTFMKRKNKLDLILDDELQEVMNESNSISQILGKLFISKSCEFYREILKKRMKNLDDSFFIKNQKTTNKFANYFNKYLIDELFCENSLADIKTIKTRYSSLYPQKNCQICNIDCIWSNKKLNLHLDHINGINSDNRLDNLRWICPNCHSQTETYAGRNVRKKIGPLGVEPSI